MKNKAIRYSIFTLGLLAVPALTGCIEETFPSQSATADMVAADPTAIKNIVNSLTNYTMATSVNGGTDYTDSGLPGLMIARDVMCEDMAVNSSEWDWFNLIAKGTGTSWGTNPYYFFYTFIDKCNDVLKKADPETLNDEGRAMIGNLYGFRAMCHFDLARSFEYQPTGYPELDNEAESNKIYGLTMPILEARDYSVSELVNNPRAPFQKMYRFIMTDLNRAEELLEGYNREKVSLLNQSVIHGFKAHLWLEMATRFNRSAEDLATQIAAEGSDDGYDDLGITSATDCYRKAIEYADKVINAGYTPMTKAEWEDPANGFNTPNNSWVWGSYIATQEERVPRWYAYCTHMTSEATWAWCSGDFNCFRMISSDLYNQIPDSDWRKRTWIDPADAGNPDAISKYSTNQTADYFAGIPAYASLKFRVKNLTDYTLGLICSVPYMRVEEFYLLRAEALAYAEGVAAGANALNNFVNSYRYTDNSYSCSTTAINYFLDDLMVQRRIEFWGEGHVFFDYKRLRLPVNRVKSNNFPEAYRLVTANNYVAPWMNFFIIPSAVSMKGPDFKGNPDFYGVVKPVN